MAKTTPRHPIYIPSKGRAGDCDTAKSLDGDGTPYRVVVEPQEFDQYAKIIDKSKLVVLPDNDQGLVYARNFCKDHATAEGHAFHWQLDDDIRMFGRVYKRRRMYCQPGLAIRTAEDFCDRYTNIRLFALNHYGFTPPTQKLPAFYLNARCYTCFCVSNAIPNRWRYRYNEDTDMALQVLADGWCSVLFNVFFMQTAGTNLGGKVVSKQGGQQAVYANDGRLKMARDLQRVWPHVVSLTRKFGRAQHTVHSSWRKFDTPLIRRDDIDWEGLPAVDERGITITVHRDIKSPDLAKLVSEYR